MNFLKINDFYLNKDFKEIYWLTKEWFVNVKI